MELVLEVSDDVARKLKGLSVLTGKSAAEITVGLSDSIESIITQEIAESIGIGTSMTVALPEHNFHRTITRIGHTEVAETDVFLDEEAEENTSEDFSSQLGESLSDLTEEELDQELPEEDIKELTPTIEETMVTKNKDGEDVEYEDEFMADMQAMADGEEYEGEDDIMAAAAASNGITTSQSMTPQGSDAPVSDTYGESADILPVDFGINSVVSDDKGAMSFFDIAINGKNGDTSKRNGVRRKAIRQ